MQILLNRLFRVESGEWPKLVQFGLFGLLLQTGLGIGFSAGDAAFLSHVGADKLPVIFLLTPAVMLAYTGIFSYLLVRFSIDHVVDVTLAMLIAGGAILWALFDAGLPPLWQTMLYYVLKLYLAMWYIALYSLFWNFTDAYFDIQDAKRLFPLFAAFCAFGTTCGAVIVSLFADAIPLHYFLLVWAVVALATVPIAQLLRRRWQRIADSDTETTADRPDARGELEMVARAFRTSRYTLVLTLTLFVTLLMTNLAEYQYSAVLQAGRSEAGLAALFGTLYAASNIFNMIICLFVFNRLVTRVGVRNVAFILPFTYFAAFGYFFLEGGTGAALAAFFAYHGVLTSIEYNNQNLLFNAVPSAIKRPLRTVVEGLCEPLASFLAGGFLLLAAARTDMRDLSGIGVILGAALIGVVILLRHFYPSAMARNMRQGWLNFGERGALDANYDPAATALLHERAADANADVSALARALLRPHMADQNAAPRQPSGTVDALADKLDHPDPAVRHRALQRLSDTASPDDIHLLPLLASRLPAMDRPGREAIIALLGKIGDTEAIPSILAAAATLSPRERRAAAAMLITLGETAIPRLMSAVSDRRLPYRARSIAARALALLSDAQFASQLDRLVREELGETRRLLTSARQFEAAGEASPAMSLLARAQRERIAASVDFVLELLALGDLLPDFDLLIVSLHSANAKVRANAVEAIENGVDRATFRMLDPLITRRDTGASDALEERDLVEHLEAAMTSGHDFEAAAAAQALRDHVSDASFARRLRRALHPGMAPALRTTIAKLLGLDGDDTPGIVDRVEGLRGVPDFAAATIDALLALCERAVSRRDGRGVGFMAGGKPYWIAMSDIQEVASRYPDLALTMLKVQDGRSYAA